MTDIKNLQSIQFYATAPYPCSYLEGREARSQVATPTQIIQPFIYDQLIDLGFRRSGPFTYRPYCDNCKACLSVRIPVTQFEPSRSQARAWVRHSDLKAKIVPLEFTAEHFELYQHYQLSRHPNPLDEQNHNTYKQEEDQYRQFLLQTQVNTLLVEFRENGILRMVSVIDELTQGMSSVYTFYDTSVPGSSYGTYGILWQINQVKELKLPYVYLGYFIEDSPKMSYKRLFKPLEALMNGQWFPLESIEL